MPGSASGTKHDLFKKIKQLKKYPNLLKKFETISTNSNTAKYLFYGKEKMSQK